MTPKLKPNKPVGADALPEAIFPIIFTIYRNFSPALFV